MNPPVKLTARQQQILELIQQAIAQTGAPPTRAEIAAELGFRSANAAEEHLQALARKGVIELVSGTSPVLAQEQGDTVYHVAPSLFASKPDYLLKVRGMSMRDVGILDGDLLAVQSTQNVRNGQIVVARVGDEVTVKRYQRLPDHIELHPENPDYPTIVVQPGEPFAIEGLAVGLIRNSVLM